MTKKKRKTIIMRGWTWIPPKKSKTPDQLLTVCKTKREAKKYYSFIMAFFDGSIERIEVKVLR